MSASLGQAIVVDNMPGASGFLAAQNVARAEPDGHTVLITSNTTHAANQSLFKKLPYDPVADFAPVSKLGTITLALVVNPSVPVATAQELIEYAKANPGELTFGSGSSSSRIAGEMLKSLAGIDLLNVPYKSNPQAITDLLGGQISMVFADISTTMPQAEAGKVKALGGVQRRAHAAGARSSDHAGGGRGRLRPDGLVRGVRAGRHAGAGRRRAERCDSRRRSPIRRRPRPCSAPGIEPAASTPEELAAFVGAETEKWAKIVETAGIEPE